MTVASVKIFSFKINGEELCGDGQQETFEELVRNLTESLMPAVDVSEWHGTEGQYLTPVDSDLDSLIKSVLAECEEAWLK